MSDVMIMRVLAKSMVSAGLLMGAAANTLKRPTPLAVVQWACWVCLLSGLYYAIYITFFRQCIGRRLGHSGTLPIAQGPSAQMQQVYMDVPQAPPPAASADDPLRPTLLEMSAASVYTYVYGWGLLLFVCLYCMTGLHEASSCWWVIGMMMLSLDDLLLRRVHWVWICVIVVLIYSSVVALWWAASGSRAIDESIGIIAWSVVLPVLSPFIFFSLRSTAWTVSRDVGMLMEVAMPFMLVIAISVLLCTTNFDSGFASVFAWPPAPRGVRTLRNVSLNAALGDSGGYGPGYGLLVNKHLSSRLNRTLGTVGRVHNVSSHLGDKHAETAAPFVPDLDSEFGADAGRGTHVLLTTKEYLVKSGNHFATLLATPFLSYFAILTLTDCVVQGYVTEFIASFMLALTVKYALVSTSTVVSSFSLAGAGACFVFLVLLRRSL